MLNNRIALLATTAVAPVLWGTTYLATTTLLPPGRPLLAAVLRALPAGLLLVAATRRLPSGAWWWRAAVLGTLNIGAFFAMLFVAAYRLPGGVAATVGAVQPLLVAALSAGLLGRRLSVRTVVAGAAGIAGVALLVLRADARLDPAGVAAALGDAAVMATGVVLSKRWTSPASVLATTGWQLVAGGLVLVPAAAVVEGPLPALTGRNVAGYLYLGVLGTAVAYSLWFRGIRALPATDVTFLGLLSPVVATAAGWAVVGQALGPGQLVGAAVVLGALLGQNLRQAPSAARTLPSTSSDNAGASSARATATAPTSVLSTTAARSRVPASTVSASR